MSWTQKFLGNTWANAVFLRHPSVRYRASEWWWVNVHSFFLFSAPSLKIPHWWFCLKSSLCESGGEGACLHTGWVLQILSPYLTQIHPWRHFHRQLPLYPYPTAAWTINKTADSGALRHEHLHHVSLLIDGLTISPRSKNRKLQLKCFNKFRDYTRGRGGGVPWRTCIKGGKYNTGIML